MRKAVVLLSGGLDSATTLYFAKDKGFKVYGLVFDYGQRHKRELVSAKKLAGRAGCKVNAVKITLPWKGSSLLDAKIKLPEGKKYVCNEIPSTYVPSRNIIFLSFAASYAETIGAWDIFIGANSIDYSGYPDCRPEFIKAFNQVLKKGMKSGLKGTAIKVKAPLLRKTKAQIIKLGTKLNVPYELTWSCYKGGKFPCGRCDSCLIRQKGFKDAGFTDPLLMKLKERF